MASNGLLPDVAAWLERAHRSAPLRMAVPADVGLVEDSGFILWGPGWWEAPELAMQTARFVEGRSDKGCLSRFVGLTDATDGEIAQFAREWGVLGFCQEHRLPGAHASCRPAIVTWKSETPGLLMYWERAEDWRSFARRLRGVLLLVYAAIEGKAQREEDFRAALPGPPPAVVKAIWEVASEEGLPSVAEISVSFFLRDGHGRLDVEWNESQKRYVLGFSFGESAIQGRERFFWPENSLYRVLAKQLLVAVTAGELAQCARCRIPFHWEQTGLHNRFPRHDRNAYCGVWCQQEARREQKAAWKRQRDKRLREQRKGEV